MLRIYCFMGFILLVIRVLGGFLVYVKRICGLCFALYQLILVISFFLYIQLLFYVFFCFVFECVLGVILLRYFLKYFFFQLFFVLRQFFLLGMLFYGFRGRGRWVFFRINKVEKKWGGIGVIDRKGKQRFFVIQMIRVQTLLFFGVNLVSMGGFGAGGEKYRKFRKIEGVCRMFFLKQVFRSRR